MYMYNNLHEWLLTTLSAINHWSKKKDYKRLTFVYKTTAVVKQIIINLLMCMKNKFNYIIINKHEIKIINSKSVLI